MKFTLKHIAAVQTGIFAHPGSSGEIVYLQVKHFDDKGKINDLIIPDLPVSNQIERHLLNDGDILFAAKGSKNFAALYDGTYGQSVASSSFLVIKLNEKYKKSILSAYLVWFLNHPKTQEFLKAKARGSSMPSISKIDLQDLEITIPTVEKQKAIIKVDTLYKQEQEIIKKIQILKEQYIKQLLIKALHK